jgi:hypothetical protein
MSIHSTNEIEQALRRSHCSNTGKEHACVGVCTITKDQVALSCVLCGRDENKNLNVNEWLEDRASSILHAAGMRYASLSDETKLAILREVAKDVCPGCKSIHYHTKRYEDYRRCNCGWEWHERSGWKPPLDISPPPVPFL